MKLIMKGNMLMELLKY